MVDEELVSKKSLMQKILNAILGFNGANGEIHIDYKAHFKIEKKDRNLDHGHDCD